MITLYRFVSFYFITFSFVIPYLCPVFVVPCSCCHVTYHSHSGLVGCDGVRTVTVTVTVIVTEYGHAPDNENDIYWQLNIRLMV